MGLLILGVLCRSIVLRPRSLNESIVILRRIIGGFPSRPFDSFFHDDGNHNECHDRADPPPS
jgi:hypothetical protein